VDDLELLRDSAKVGVNGAVNMLEHGDYDLLERRMGLGLTVQELRDAVDAYPVRLVAPPDEIYKNLDFIQEPEAVPPRFHVAVRLWAEHDGPSRFVMKFRVTQEPHIHVLAMRTEIVGLDLEDL
jgi:hypothetical protein